MNSDKRAIFTGLAAGILFTIVLCILGFGAVVHATTPTSTAPGSLPPCPGPNGGLCILTTNPTATTVKGDGVVTPPPLSAIVVTQCGLAVSLFIQLDATHLLRADPRQSDMFTAVDGKQVQSQAGPMKIDEAMVLAKAAVLSTNVTLPCTEGPTV